jgi:hypothetical protein
MCWAALMHAWRGLRAPPPLGEGAALVVPDADAAVEVVVAVRVVVAEAEVDVGAGPPDVVTVVAGAVDVVVEGAADEVCDVLADDVVVVVELPPHATTARLSSSVAIPTLIRAEFISISRARAPLPVDPRRHLQKARVARVPRRPGLA